jgi:hypothetical protein
MNPGQNHFSDYPTNQALVQQPSVREDAPGLVES